MTTVQDIQSKTFEKAYKGYNMQQVDEFLDQLAADMAALMNDNNQLRQKMRVLVEKVEEYRQTEDSMRLALLSAQKMSSQIEGDAREKADSIVAEAREAADRITRRSTEGIANEEAKLEEARKATRKFFEHMRAVCEKQIEFYNKLSQMRLVGDEPAPAAAPVVSRPVPAPEPVAEPAPAPAPATESAPAPAPAPVPTPAPAPAPAVSKEQAAEEAIRSIENRVNSVPMAEEPAVEDEPTRRIDTEFTGVAPKKKRSFDDFSFDDDI